MKNKVSALFTALLVVALLSGCGTAPQTAEPTNVNVGALKGPTAMGMVKLMEDDETSQQHQMTIYSHWWPHLTKCLQN